MTTKQMNRDAQPSITKKDIDDSLVWLRQQNTEQLPESLVRLICWLPDLFKNYEAKKNSVTKLLNELARAFHQIPSSEKTPCAAEIPLAKNEALPVADNEASSSDIKTLEQLNETLTKIRKLKKYLSCNEKKVCQKIEAISVNDKETLGDTNNQVKNECLFHSPCLSHHHSHEEAALTVQEEELLKEQKGIVIEKNTRQKHDFIFMRNDTTITFNTYFDPKTGHKYAPDLALIGPQNHNVTWRGIINAVTLVMGMAMPASRVEKFFGSNGFSRANILRYMGLCAEALAPIYLYFGTQIAQSEVIEADDTNSRVHELNRYFRKVRLAQKNKDSTFLAPPWETQQEEDDPEKKESLFQTINEQWSFVSKRQDGKGDKQQLHTTCLSALSNQSDLKTRLILYRSHIGSVGNLLSKILEERKTTKDKLTIVSDLSSQNLVKNDSVTKKIQIDYAGCASHARRLFARFLAYDFDNCLEMLDYFKALSEIEKMGEKLPHRKAHYRQHTESGAISFWDDIKQLCLKMNERWSKETELGKATRYIIDNLDTLTKYIYDLRLPLTNNRSERLLRYEKLMDSSSFGRDTLTGRVRYDILRSYFQTCSFAQISPGIALLEVLLTDKEAVKNSPQKFTPQAIQARLNGDPERLNLLNRILTETKLVSLAKYEIDLSKVGL